MLKQLFLYSGQIGPSGGSASNTGSGKMMGSNAQNTNSMEANIRRMNAANAKNLGITGPKTLGKCDIIYKRPSKEIL